MMMFWFFSIYHPPFHAHTLPILIPQHLLSSTNYILILLTKRFCYCLSFSARMQTLWGQDTVFFVCVSILFVIKKHPSEGNLQWLLMSMNMPLFKGVSKWLENLSLLAFYSNYQKKCTRSKNSIHKFKSW